VVEGWSAGVSSFGIDGVTTVTGLDSTMGAGGLIVLAGSTVGFASITGIDGVGGLTATVEGWSVGDSTFRIGAATTVTGSAAFGGLSLGIGSAIAAGAGGGFGSDGVTTGGPGGTMTY
jgi:hypothetical protein